MVCINEIKWFKIISNVEFYLWDIEHCNYEKLFLKERPSL